MSVRDAAVRLAMYVAASKVGRTAGSSHVTPLFLAYADANEGYLDAMTAFLADLTTVLEALPEEMINAHRDDSGRPGGSADALPEVP